MPFYCVENASSTKASDTKVKEPKFQAIWYAKDVQTSNYDTAI